MFLEFEKKKENEMETSLALISTSALSSRLSECDLVNTRGSKGK
jgi:hypothetical protein